MDYLEPSDDERRIAAEQRKAQLEDERQIAELNSILSTDGGRFFMWRLLEQAGVFRTNLDTDALAMAFKEGRRSIGLWLVQELHRADPKAFTRVCHEGVSRATVDSVDTGVV